MIVRELLTKFGFEVDEASTAHAVAAGNLVSKGLEKVVEWAFKAAEAFVENAKEAIEYGDHVKKTAQKIGLATDALQELSYVSSLSDVSAESMAQAIGHLSKNMQEAKEGGAEAAKALKGIDYQQGDKLRSADEVLASVAEKFKSLPDGAEKTALSMRLFGRAGRDLIPMLNEGSDGIAELRQEARDLGLVLDEDAVEASEQLNDNLTRLHAVSKGLWRQVVGALLPGINNLVKRFLEWRKASAAWIREKLSGFFQGLITVVNASIEVFKSLVRVGGAIYSMLEHMAMGAVNFVREYPRLGAVLLALGTALLLIESPMLAIIAAFSALYLVVDDLITYMQGGDSLFGRWKKSLDEWLKPQPKDTWFVAAIKAFVEFLTDALKLTKQFNDELNSNKTPGQKAVAAGKYAAGTQQSALNDIGVPKLGYTKTADQRYEAARAQGASWWEAAKAGLGFEYSPTMEASAPTNMSSMVSAPVQINVTTQPGQSNEHIASMISDQVQSHWDSKMEEAAGAGQR